MTSPRARQGGGDPAGLRQHAVGMRARHAARLLPLERQKRIGRRGAGPALRVEAREPRAIERQSRGFEYAEDLDRRRRRLGLEQRIAEQRAQRIERCHRRQRARDRAHRCELRERRGPRFARLPLRARQRRGPGPAERHQPVGPGARPFARQARRLRRRRQRRRSVDEARDRNALRRTTSCQPTRRCPSVSPVTFDVGTRRPARLRVRQKRRAYHASGGRRVHGTGCERDEVERARDDRDRRQRLAQRNAIGPRRIGRECRARVPGKGFRRRARRPRRDAGRDRRRRSRRSTAASPGAAPARSRARTITSSRGVGMLVQRRLEGSRPRAATSSIVMPASRSAFTSRRCCGVSAMNPYRMTRSASPSRSRLAICIRTSGSCASSIASSAVRRAWYLRAHCAKIAGSSLRAFAAIAPTLSAASRQACNVVHASAACRAAPRAFSQSRSCRATIPCQSARAAVLSSSDAARVAHAPRAPRATVDRATASREGRSRRSRHARRAPVAPRRSAPRHRERGDCWA